MATVALKTFSFGVILAGVDEITVAMADALFEAVATTRRLRVARGS